MAFDIYQAVTDRIIAAMEQGVIPWMRPWTGTTDGAIKHISGKPYSLLNQILLGKPGEWLTFEQCKKEGGHVRKGAKARMVVFWKIYGYADKDKVTVDGLPVIKQVPVLKYYNVFHIDDCEGITPRHPDPEPFDTQPIEAAERILTGYVQREKIPLIIEKSNRAFYRPGADEIHIPLLEQFESAAEYYSTAFHEATHSTGHPKRLNRIALDDAAASFGSESYSKEELVAEIGACAILNRLHIETENSFRNSAGYLQSWLQQLRNDKKLIVSAAGKADKAVRMIMGEAETDDGE